MRQTAFGSLNGLLSALRRPAEDEHAESDELARLWGVASCAHCGHTILLGEKSSSVLDGGEVVILCEACSAAARPTRRAA